MLDITADHIEFGIADLESHEVQHGGKVSANDRSARDDPLCSGKSERGRADSGTESAVSRKTTRFDN